jgi:hypothetical protein
MATGFGQRDVMDRHPAALTMRRAGSADGDKYEYGENSKSDQHGTHPDPPTHVNHNPMRDPRQRKVGFRIKNWAAGRAAPK